MTDFISTNHVTSFHHKFHPSYDLTPEVLRMDFDQFQVKANKLDFSSDLYKWFNKKRKRMRREYPNLRSVYFYLWLINYESLLKTTINIGSCGFPPVTQNGPWPVFSQDLQFMTFYDIYRSLTFSRSLTVISKLHLIFKIHWVGKGANQGVWWPSFE